MSYNVDFLRTELLKMGLDERDVAAMNKKELIEKYNSLQNVVIDFEKAETTPTTLENALNVKYGTPEWQEFIISQLTPDELSDGCPKCNGLRRVANLYLGPILSSGAKQVLLAVNSDGKKSVTVNYEIVFDWILDRPAGVFVNINQDFNDKRTFCGLADCTEDQTVYGKHPAATAESKAESRALRKALMLNVVTAEEKVTGMDNELPTVRKGANIPKPLIDAITAKAKRLNIDLASCLKEHNLPTTLSDLTIEQGRFVFEKIINHHQQVTT